MKKEQIELFKKQLLKEKEDKENSLFSDKLGFGSSIKEDTGELSSYDNHPGDLGTEMFETEKNISFRNNYKTIIKLIDKAIDKIEEGKYGYCEMCNRVIDIDRLKLIPYARYCFDCENSLELQSGNKKGRPIEEEVISPPFGRSFKDDSIDGDVQFDGEDAWQAVNVYNVVTSDNPYSKEDSMGYVENVESISNEKYKKQLE